MSNHNNNWVSQPIINPNYFETEEDRTWAWGECQVELNTGECEFIKYPLPIKLSDTFLTQQRRGVLEKASTPLPRAGLGRGKLLLTHKAESDCKLRLEKNRELERVPVADPMKVCPFAVVKPFYHMSLGRGGRR